MKSQAFASAWLSPLVTSAPAPLSPLPSVQRAPRCFVPLPWHLPEKEQVLILANPTWPQQALWSALIFQPPVQVQVLYQGTPGARANPCQVSQIQPTFHRVNHDIQTLSGFLYPGIPTHIPRCPLQCLQIPDCTLVLLTAVGKPHHCCNPGSRHLSPQLCESGSFPGKGSVNWEHKRVGSILSQKLHTPTSHLSSKTTPFPPFSSKSPAILCPNFPSSLLILVLSLLLQKLGVDQIAPPLCSGYVLIRFLEIDFEKAIHTQEVYWGCCQDQHLEEWREQDWAEGKDEWWYSHIRASVQPTGGLDLSCHSELPY